MFPESLLISKYARRVVRGVSVVVMLLAYGRSLAGGTGGLIELSAGIHRIEAEVVATSVDRAQGLMHRTSLSAGCGMVFVFPEHGRHCMWMKNTLIPLSVAFVDANGVITNIAEMQPRSLDNHCADRPAKYALEMNGGWFRSHGIVNGMKIGGLEKAPPAR